MSTTTGILFALAAMVLWGFEEFFLKEAITGLKSLTTYLINTITGVALQILVVIFFFDAAVTFIPWPDFALALFAATVAFLGFLCFYLALERQELSLIASLDESWIIISILIGVVAFGESMGFLHLASIVAVLFGAFLVSVDFSRLKRLRFISGSGYELASVILIGFSIPLEKVVLERVGEANAIIYLATLVIPMIFIARLFLKEKFVRPSRGLLKVAIWSGCADGLAFIFYLLALKVVDISIISPIVASSIVVSVLLARTYLQERMTQKEIAGAALILGGVIVLSTFVPV